MTTTTETPTPVTSEPTVPAAAEPALTIPLSAILEFERETAALGGVLDVATDAEDETAQERCVSCHVEQSISMALDPNSVATDSFRTEALFTPAASSASPDCTCDQSSPDAPCSETCVDPACVAAVMHARYGG